MSPFAGQVLQDKKGSYMFSLIMKDKYLEN